MTQKKHYVCQRTEDWLQKAEKIKASDVCNKKQLLGQHQLFHPPLIKVNA